MPIHQWQVMAGGGGAKWAAALPGISSIYNVYGALTSYYRSYDYFNIFILPFVAAENIF